MMKPRPAERKMSPEDAERITRLVRLSGFTMGQVIAGFAALQKAVLSSGQAVAGLRFPSRSQAAESDGPPSSPDLRPARR